MRDFLLLALKGIPVGVANIIPGVSGGTMAVVLGIYERLIEALGGFLTDKERRCEHGLFLAAVGIGAVAGIVLLAGVMGWALSNHPALTLLFFMGLILGSLPTVARQHAFPKATFSLVLWVSVGVLVVLALGVPQEKPADSGLAQNVAYVPLAVAGFFAGGAMIVPGVSGSLVMLLLGQYVTIVGAISSGKDRLLGGDVAGFAGHEGLIIAIVGASAGVGVVVFAKLIRLALHRAPGATHAFIVGLVAGSVVVIFPGLPSGAGGMALGAALFLVGALLSAVIESKPVA